MVESKYKEEVLLFRAVSKKNFRQVVRIIERGQAQAQHRNQDGKTVIMVPNYFEESNSKRIFNYLVDHGLSVNSVTKSGKTAMHFAVEAKNFYLVKLLIKRHAELRKDKDGNHPLFMAALETKESKIFERLLNYVGDPKMESDALLLRDCNNFLLISDKKSVEAFNIAKNRMLSTIGDVTERRQDSGDDVKVLGSLRSDYLKIFEINKNLLGRNNLAYRRAMYIYMTRIGLTQKIYEREQEIIHEMIFLYLEHEPMMVERTIGNFLECFQRILYTGKQDEEDPEETEQSKIALAAHIFELISDILEAAPYQKLKAPNFRKWCTILAYFAIGLYCRIDSLDGTLLKSKEQRKYSKLDLNRFVRNATALEIPLVHSLDFVSKFKLIRHFVKAGANINGKDLNGETALAALFVSNSAQRHNLFHFSYRLSEGYWPLVTELIRLGARTFVYKNGFTVRKWLKRQKGYDPCNSLDEEITLKDLAAQVVEAHYSLDYLKKKLPAADELQPHKLECQCSKYKAGNSTSAGQFTRSPLEERVGN
ncbi:unnamed protein product [Caenorhabditis auriculariae]|uniref:Uncharacterized protein n=1 Tax=Caenorhabditis auriculariae TaxID=2777116 RepID=A0A8S1GZM4_9PELO|nr:unnamed protein product [Caenorhabditis auriculariae]